MTDQRVFWGTESRELDVEYDRHHIDQRQQRWHYYYHHRRDCGVERLWWPGAPPSGFGGISPQFRLIVWIDQSFLFARCTQFSVWLLTNFLVCDYIFKFILISYHYSIFILFLKLNNRPQFSLRLLLRLLQLLNPSRSLQRLVQQQVCCLKVVELVNNKSLNVMEKIYLENAPI